MTDFINILRADIEAQRQKSADRISRLVPIRYNGELPVSAYLGTVWVKSAAGSAIEFYSWRESQYCHGPMYETEDVALTHATVHNLARMDRAYFHSWEDFTMYDMEAFHSLLHRLLRCNFTLYEEIYLS